jgi:hypothetical protein
MLKKLAFLTALVVVGFAITAAQAGYRCQLENGQMAVCRGNPPPAVRGADHENERQIERRPVIKGPKFGVGADEFPVVGIRAGEHFDGVDKPESVKRCYENGGKIVAKFAEVMPNGQSRYENICEPRS